MRAVPQRAAAVAAPVVLPAVAAVQDARSEVAVVQDALPGVVAAQVVLLPAAEVQDAPQVAAAEPDELRQPAAAQGERPLAAVVLAGLPREAAAEARPDEPRQAEAAQGERPVAAVVLAGLPPEAVVGARPDELQRAAEAVPAEAMPVEPQRAAHSAASQPAAATDGAQQLAAVRAAFRMRAAIRADAPPPAELRALTGGVQPPERLAARPAAPDVLAKAVKRLYPGLLPAAPAPADQPVRTPVTAGRPSLARTAQSVPAAPAVAPLGIDRGAATAAAVDPLVAGLLAGDSRWAL